MKKTEINKNKSRKNVLKTVLSKILYIMFLIMVIYNIIFLINSTITKNDYLSIFGISINTMNSDKMKPEIFKNSIIISKTVESNELEVGDNITYVVSNEIITSKIVNIIYKDNEEKYITKYIQTYYPNNEEISINMIIGKEVLSIMGLGFIVKVAQSKIFTLIVLIFLVFKFLYNKEKYIRTKKRRLKKKRFDEI